MKLADRAGIMILAGGLGRVIQIGLGIILARLLLSDTYGTYRQVWLLVGGFLPTLQMAIPMSFYYFFPRLPPKRQGTLVRQTTGMIMVIGALASLILLVGAVPIAAAFNNPALVPVLRAFSLYPFLYFPANLLLPVTISLERPAIGAFMNLGMLTVQAALTAGLIWGGATLSTLFGTLVVLSSANLAFTLLLFSKLLPKGGALWEPKLLKEQLAYSWPFGLSVVVDMLNVELDKLIISMKFTPELFAVYAIGATELPFLDVLRGSVNSVLRPAIAKLHDTGETGELLELWHGALRKQGLFAMCVFGFFLVHADTFITALYSERYAASALFFSIYLFLIPLRLLGPAVLLSSIGSTKVLFRASQINLAVNLPLSLGLLSLIGVSGPAIATVIAVAIATIHQSVHLARLLKVPLKKVYPFKALLVMAAVSLLIALGTKAIDALPLHDLITVSLAGVLHVVVYLVIMDRLRYFSTDDRAFLLRWIRLSPLFGSKADEKVDVDKCQS